MKAAIFYGNYMDFNGEKLLIGGIETYLRSLSRLFVKMNIEPIIFQYSFEYFEKEVDGIQVKGLPVLSLGGRFAKYRAFKLAAHTIDLKKDIVVFGSERHAVNTGGNRCVSIQHGISWDLPNRFLTERGLWNKAIFNKMYKLRMGRIAIKNYERCPNRVCVDYNFLNWYKTYLCGDLIGNNWIIPNFTDIPVANPTKQALNIDDRLNVLFPRRFHKYRGTRIMAYATKSLLRRFPNVFFTFAGEGPDESWLREYFADDARVSFVKYEAAEIIDIYQAHHIAVIPSIASEGTCLSVAEAMACGCVVVATAVGGITNMIIDGYNGKLCMPDAGELERVIESLLIDSKQREVLAGNAFNIAKSAFSKEKWENSWRDVIEVISEL